MYENYINQFCKRFIEEYCTEEHLNEITPLALGAITVAATVAAVPIGNYIGTKIGSWLIGRKYKMCKRKPTAGDDYTMKEYYICNIRKSELALRLLQKYPCNKDKNPELCESKRKTETVNWKKKLNESKKAYMKL